MCHAAVTRAQIEGDAPKPHELWLEVYHAIFNLVYVLQIANRMYESRMFLCMDSIKFQNRFHQNRADQIYAYFSLGTSKVIQVNLIPITLTSAACCSFGSSVSVVGGLEKTELANRPHRTIDSMNPHSRPPRRCAA